MLEKGRRGGDKVRKGKGKGEDSILLNKGWG